MRGRIGAAPYAPTEVSSNSPQATSNYISNGRLVPPPFSPCQPRNYCQRDPSTLRDRQPQINCGENREELQLVSRNKSCTKTTSHGLTPRDAVSSFRTTLYVCRTGLFWTRTCQGWPKQCQAVDSPVHLSNNTSHTLGDCTFTEHRVMYHGSETFRVTSRAT